MQQSPDRQPNSRMPLCRDDLSVDLRRHFSHITNSRICWPANRAGDVSDYGGEPHIMDTNSFDKQSKQHLKIYENVMFAAKICIVAIIVTLVIMAATGRPLWSKCILKTQKGGNIPPFFMLSCLSALT
jgi:hypothetical protein